MVDRVCARKGCREYSCEHKSEKFGYICDECFDELLRAAPKSQEDIAKFMETEPETVEDFSVNLVFDEFPNTK